MAFCASCGASVTGTFCPTCGKPATLPSAGATPLPPPAAPVKRKISPLVWILVGLAGLVVLLVVGGGVIAAIAVPRLNHARMQAQEMAAISVSAPSRLPRFNTIRSMVDMPLPWLNSVRRPAAYRRPQART